MRLPENIPERPDWNDARIPREFHIKAEERQWCTSRELIEGGNSGLPSVHAVKRVIRAGFDSEHSVVRLITASCTRFTGWQWLVDRRGFMRLLASSYNPSEVPRTNPRTGPTRRARR